MAGERLNSISLHQEMQRSYLEYAMSVIVGRALPDSRDGLKPVQRRILFAMHELGLTPDRPFKKCARVVGDVLGKYHPHGDQAVYDALVRLVQEFNCNYPVLDGHGNFGSIDDDPAAAMRYTETRLAEISYEAILKEIDSETVDFSQNFDGSQQEPNVLPAQLPFLILNGCTGIAVGMATSIPPHNINEVISGLIKLIKKPNLSDEELMKIIPGPDFPTGGEVLLSNGIKETYFKGRGSIAMRGVAHIEEVIPGKGKHKRTGIVITELPYQVSKSGWIEKLAEQVNDGKINGIADIRDETDRAGMRILIEVRRDSDPNKILKELYRKTNLQSNYGAILLALVNGQPKQLSLKDLLVNFLEFREHTIIKRTNNSLNKITNRLEIIEALIKALKNLKTVISMLEQAKDVNEARESLMKKLILNNKQADGVLSMPLRRLTSLEKESLFNELKILQESEIRLKLILNNRKELLNIMVNEFKQLKKKFGKDRRTNLIKGGDELLAERNASLRPNRELQKKQAFDNLPKDGVLVININNEVKVINSKVINKLGINEEVSLSKDLKPANLIISIKNKPKILAITSEGKVGILQWEFSGQNPGSIDKFLPSGMEKEKIIDLIVLNNSKKENLGLLTSDGRFKQLSITEILDMSNRSITLLKLKNSISLNKAIICKENSELIVITNIGRILRLNINNKEFPIMGKLAQGPQIMNLFPNENIQSAFNYSSNLNNYMILITEKGSLLKYKISSIRQCKKGQLGIIGINLKDKGNQFDRIADAFTINQTTIINTSENRLGQINASQMHNLIENKLYNKFFSLNENEKVTKVVNVFNNLNL